MTHARSGCQRASLGLFSPDEALTQSRLRGRRGDAELERPGPSCLGEEDVQQRGEGRGRTRRSSLKVWFDDIA